MYNIFIYNKKLKITMSYIPEFEFNKDSYILKHKIDYNTRCDGDWSGMTYGVLFTDYDLARKTQSKNAEMFQEIDIDVNVEDVSAIRITKYDQEHTVVLFGRWFYTHEVSGTTIESGATFLSTNEYQQYYVSPGSTSLFQEGDLFNVYFHNIIDITGSTEWTHFGPSGETWVANGLTENGVSYQVTGTTTENGFSSGTTTYYVTDYVPILKYSARSTEVGNDYIKLERKLEDYIYNNIMKMAKDYYYETVSYTIESLHYSDSSYYGVKYILEETMWGKYFNISASSNNLKLTPIPNKEDLYFDYDNVEIYVFTTGDTIDYKFESDCLYAKYKLEPFLEQIGFDSGTTINEDKVCLVDLNTEPFLTGKTSFNVILNDIDDIYYFTPYTYIYVNTSGSSHICLILEIKDDNLTLLTPNVTFTNGEQLISIQNLHTVEDISKMLYEVFINIESEVIVIDTSDFYLGNYYDPNFDDGLNIYVIDPNIEEGGYVFDPEYIE